MQPELQKEVPYEMESVQDKHDRRVRSFWNWSVGTVIAGIIAFFPVNKAYDEYHVRLAKDAVYPEITELQKSIKETQDTGVKSAGQIDYLVKANRRKFCTSDGLPVEQDTTVWANSGFGAQPLVWNPHGDLENNLGSGGNYTRVGPIRVGDSGSA